MKINKFTKKKNGMYHLTLEDESKLLVHEDIILKHQLLIKKSLSKEEEEKILQENLIYIAYDLALKCISIKMRSKKEIENYLINKKVDSFIIKEVIEMLEKAKYIDENLYANAFINDKIHLTNDGPNKIIRQLQNQDIGWEVIQENLAVFSEELQKEKIDKIAKKMIKTNQNKSNIALKNKIVDYLMNLGYEQAIIHVCLSNLDFKEDHEIAQKEYEKIYKKLARKYSGKELEYKVKQKMYSLGFKNMDIS